MGKYIAQRLVALVIILFIVSLFSFMLIHLLPGDPLVVILGYGGTKAERIATSKFYGFNKPLFEQYWTWISHVVRGNLGKSFISDEVVSTTIGQALPIDLQLVLMSQILAFGFAVPLAFRAARKPGGFLDKTLTGSTFVLLSVPAFVVIILMELVLVSYGHLTNLGSSEYSVGGNWWLNFQALLPGAFTLAIGSFVVYFRVFRSDLIATYQEEFIVMARSKGISRRRILWRHALRPSSISLLATAGVNISGLVAGTFIVEYLLGIPGLGKLLVTGIESSDWILVQGIVLVVASIVVALNFTIDLCFGLIDPRISRD